jgi:hypothetical protein
LARGYGLKLYDETKFNESSYYFRYSIFYGCYSNLATKNAENTNNTEITYSDFIASLTPNEIDYSTEVMKIHPEATVYTGTMGKKIKIGDNETPYFTTFFEAWRYAYQMLPHTPNHTEQPDMVNHPKHYNVDGYEVIDIIYAFKLNFNMGSALKYLLRAERKGKKIEDLKKAIWCIQYEIEQSEKQK